MSKCLFTIAKPSYILINFLITIAAVLPAFAALEGSLVLYCIIPPGNLRALKMSTSAINAVWETIITTTVATGVNDIYIWDAATLPIPASPTTYTAEGLRVVQVNPTELIIGGATQSTSADHTLIAGGPELTLPSGKDWLPQTISLGYNSIGNSLYLGPRISTDTYPPHILATVTNTATAFPTITVSTEDPEAETQLSTTTSMTRNTSSSSSRSSEPPFTTTNVTLTSTNSSTVSSSSLSVSITNPTSAVHPTNGTVSSLPITLAFISFTPNGPALTVPTTTTPTTDLTSLTSNKNSTSLATTTGTGIGSLILNPFQSAAVGANEGSWSLGYTFAYMVLIMGLRWRVWT